MDYPITQAVRHLRRHNVSFEPCVFDYVERGGTRHSAAVLGVDEHSVIKTLIFETDSKVPFVVLMHGDLSVSTKNLARYLGVRSIDQVTPEKAAKLTGYLTGGTSPFGTKSVLPIYVERTIFDLDRILINAGKRGFLVRINPKVLSEILKIEVVEIGISKITSDPGS